MARDVKRPGGSKPAQPRGGKPAVPGERKVAPMSGRGLTVRVKTAKQRTASSARWLERQLNDPYVAEAQRLGYRSRAAFKLVQLDDRFGFLAPGKRIVDLGCAPGGWTQVAVQRVRAGAAAGGTVVGIDYLAMDTVPGAETLRLDFLDPTAPDRLKDLLCGPADVGLSDMAAPAPGHPATAPIR